jgi:hypothetical protein
MIEPHPHQLSLFGDLQIKWQDKVPDTEAVTRAKVPGVCSLL